MNDTQSVLLTTLLAILAGGPVGFAGYWLVVKLPIYRRLWRWHRAAVDAALAAPRCLTCGRAVLSALPWWQGNDDDEGTMIDACPSCASCMGCGAAAETNKHKDGCKHA